MSSGADDPKRPIQDDILGLTDGVTDLIGEVRELAAGLRFGRRVLVTLVAVVTGLVVAFGVLAVLAFQVREVQDTQGLLGDDLRTVQCDSASLWLSLLDLPQPPPDPPLTPEEQAQADAALEEFTATYTGIYESLACAELER